MALPLYAITLFVSAFILFLVQPIVGKIILPKLGGTPQVWNTCMVFFQMVLLAGYAYTHNASTRLTLRQQLMAHAVLLFLPLIVLLPFPFSLGGTPVSSPAAQAVGGVSPEWSLLGFRESSHSLWGFVPDLGANPIPSTLTILFLYVALPFLVVSTTAPLLQKWFAHTGHPAAKDPYFLYGASNLGSMLSLILYPIVIEPMVSIRGQGWIYVIGYLCLIGFVFACAIMVWNSKESAHLKLAPEVKPQPAPAAAQASAEAVQTGVAAGAPAVSGSAAFKQGQPRSTARPGTRPNLAGDSSLSIASDEVTFGRRFRWVLLAAVPSSLMLGITTHITTDLSPIPLFWLVPLILYLLSFILVFARWPVVWVGTPHTYMVFAQPFCIALMIMVMVFNLESDTSFIAFAILAHVLGFFLTTMVCHGELAKDRPGTRHLTEFYLCMSLGGMLGGMFNALIAPVVFWKLWEFPLAIFAAALVRPKMFDLGLGDNFFSGLLEGQPAAAPGPKPGQKGKVPQHHSIQAAHADESFVGVLDWAWPVAIAVLCIALMFIVPLAVPAGSRTGSLITTGLIFGIPLALCCLCMARPIRIGMGIGAVLLIHLIYQTQHDSRSIFSSRSYFGTISVKDGVFGARSEGKEVQLNYTQLVHGHINHGLNFEVPTAKKDRGNPERDYSRLATTYYHREGPVGRVMEKFNWFPGPANTYHADVRMPASLVGNAVADFGLGSILPLTELVTLWTEPPFATVGLGTGTMASYGRPYQQVHFYEIDNQILRLSLLQPTRDIGNFKEYDAFRSTKSKATYFNYLERALERGSTVQVLMGDARLRMAMPYDNHYTDKTNRGGGPNNFYHMMVVDAFSSDAIPAHLLTRQAFQMYFEKLTEDGILCVHTSNRFVDLPKVVAAVADDLNLRCLRGHDINDDHQSGHYTSEWVMVARKQDYLKHLTGDEAFLTRYNAALRAKNRTDTYWERPAIESKYLWTDDYYNLMSVVRFR